MLMAVIRAVFVLVVGGLAARFSKLAGDNSLVPPKVVPWLFMAAMGGAILVVVLDLLTPRKRVQTISGIYFGLIVGLILSGLLQFAIEPSLQMLLGDDKPLLSQSITAILAVMICYVCVSTILQTKDDFRFIIPYMEFSRDVKGTRPLVLDTSVIIDGRIADVAEAKILDQPLVVPRFVLQELHGIADSSDKLRRNRGRRGLDVLNRLQKMPGCEVSIHEGELAELAGIREVDQKLIVLAKHLGGKVVTNDYNLNKIAKLQGVDVINLNDVANALKPIVLPGETLTVKLIKRGEEPGQGVGYLDDGTMVVAKEGLHHLGEVIRLTVTSVLQTSSGRMFFGRLESVVSGGGSGSRKSDVYQGPAPGNGGTPPPGRPSDPNQQRPSSERQNMH